MALAKKDRRANRHMNKVNANGVSPKEVKEKLTQEIREIDKQTWLATPKEHRRTTKQGQRYLLSETKAGNETYKNWQRVYWRR